MSNFAFLQSEWSTLYGAAIKAEEMANSDSRTSCFYARRTLELAVDWLYKHDKTLRLPCRHQPAGAGGGVPARPRDRTGTHAGSDPGAGSGLSPA